MPKKSLGSLLAALLVTVLVAAGVVTWSAPAHAAPSATPNKTAILKPGQQNTQDFVVTITGLPSSVRSVFFEFTRTKINTDIPDLTNSATFQTGTSNFAKCPGYEIAVKSEVSALGSCLTFLDKSTFKWSGGGSDSFVTLGQTFVAVFPAGSLNFSSQSVDYLNVKLGTTSGVISSGFFTLTQSTTTAQAALTVSSVSGVFGSPLLLATEGGSTSGTVTYAVANGSASGCSISSGSLSSTSAGTCLVTATMAGNDTYDPVSSAQTTITLGKASRSLVFSSTQPITLPYGATETVTATPVPSSNPIDGTVTYAATGGCSVNTATGEVKVTSSTDECTVSASISEGSNYLAATTTSDVVINSTRKNLTVSALGASVNYGTVYETNFSTTGLVVPDAIGSVTFEYVGINGTDYGPVSEKPVNAGTYTVRPISVVFSSGTESNYNVSYAQAFIDISKGNRSITFLSSTTVAVQYGNSTTVTSVANFDPNDGTTTYSLSGDSDACEVNALSGEVTVTKSTGTCKVFAQIGEGVNYLAATTTSPVVVTVSPRAITVTASSPSSTVGGSFAPAFTVSSGTLVGADTIAIITYNYSSASYPSSTTAPTEIGTYTITPSAAVFSEGSSSNYTVTYAVGTLTILEKTSRTISFVSTTYTVEFGDTQIVSVLVSGGSSDGTVSYSAGSSSACTVDASTGIIEVTSGSGTCSVTATITEGIQYLAATTSTPLTVTVEPRKLTLAANDLTVAYGSAVTPSYAINSGTLHGTDELSGVSYQYAGTGSTTYASSATAPTGGGTYSIAPSAAIFSAGSAANYAITYVAGTLQINQNREPTVTMTLSAAVGTRVLGSTLTFSASGLQSSTGYEVVMRSEPQILSSGMTTGGSASGTTSIPTKLEAGWHTLTFSSSAPDGSRFTESMYIKISANGTLLESTNVMPAELARTGFGLGWMPTAGTLALLLGLALFTGVRFRRSRP